MTHNEQADLVVFLEAVGGQAEMLSQPVYEMLGILGKVYRREASQEDIEVWERWRMLYVKYIHELSKAIPLIPRTLDRVDAELFVPYPSPGLLDEMAKKYGGD